MKNLFIALLIGILVISPASAFFVFGYGNQNNNQKVGSTGEPNLPSSNEPNLPSTNEVNLPDQFEPNLLDLFESNLPYSSEPNLPDNLEPNLPGTNEPILPQNGAIDDNNPRNNVPLDVPSDDQPSGKPSNIPAFWNNLPDVTIRQASPSGTVIQRNVLDQCIDPDSQRHFAIASKSNNFDLFFVGKDLQIFKLKPTFVGKEVVTLTCNGALESFTLTVAPLVRANNAPADIDDADGDAIELHISSIRLPDAASNGMIPVRLTFKNNGNKKLENVKATVVIQDLGVRASVGPMDLSSGKRASRTLYLELPQDVQSGWYYARVMIDSTGLHRVKHRDVEVIV